MKRANYANKKKNVLWIKYFWCAISLWKVFEFRYFLHINYIFCVLLFATQFNEIRSLKKRKKKKRKKRSHIVFVTPYMRSVSGFTHTVARCTFKKGFLSIFIQSIEIQLNTIWQSRTCLWYDHRFFYQRHRISGTQSTLYYLIWISNYIRLKISCVNILKLNLQ